MSHCIEYSWYYDGFVGWYRAALFTFYSGSISIKPSQCSRSLRRDAIRSDQSSVISVRKLAGIQRSFPRRAHATSISAREYARSQECARNGQCGCANDKQTTSASVIARTPEYIARATAICMRPKQPWTRQRALTCLQPDWLPCLWNPGQGP